MCEGVAGWSPAQHRKKKILKYKFIQVAWIGSNIISYIYFQFTKLLFMSFNSGWYGFHSSREVSKLLFSRAICK